MSTTLQAAPKRVAMIALGIAFALLATLSLAPAAEASSRPIDFLSYSVPDKVISSRGDVRLPVTVKVKKEKDYLGHKADHYISPSPGVDDTLYSSNRQKIEPFETYLSRNKELGKYTISKTSVTASYRCYDSYWGWHECKKSYTDRTTKSFYIRAKSKTSMTSSRKGKTVTVNIKSTSFNLDANKYTAYNAKNAKLQVKSGKTWKTIKTVPLKSGRATVKITSSTKKQYRFTYDKTSTRTGATSNIIAR